MSKINTIFPVDEWEIDDNNKYKLYNNDNIYRVVIGVSSYKPYCSKISYFFSENILEQIMNNEIMVLAYPNSEIPIVLLDKNLEYVAPINGFHNFVEKYDEIQKEYVKCLKKQ